MRPNCSAGESSAYYLPTKPKFSSSQGSDFKTALRCRRCVPSLRKIVATACQNPRGLRQARKEQGKNCGKMSSWGGKGFAIRYILAEKKFERWLPNRMGVLFIANDRRLTRRFAARDYVEWPARSYECRMNLYRLVIVRCTSFILRSKL